VRPPEGESHYVSLNGDAGQAERAALAQVGMGSVGAESNGWRLAMNDWADHQIAATVDLAQAVFDCSGLLRGRPVLRHHSRWSRECLFDRAGRPRVPPADQANAACVGSP